MLAVRNLHQFEKKMKQKDVNIELKNCFFSIIKINVNLSSSESKILIFFDVFQQHDETLSDIFVRNYTNMLELLETYSKFSLFHSKL